MHRIHTSSSTSRRRIVQAAHATTSASARRRRRRLILNNQNHPAIFSIPILSILPVLPVLPVLHVQSIRSLTSSASPQRQQSVEASSATATATSTLSNNTATIPTQKSSPSIGYSKKYLRQRENRYKNAARSIPYWLGNDPDCYTWTMQALQLNANNNSSSNNNNSAPYRQIYLDSLASFYETVLSTDATTTSSSSTTTAIIDAAIDTATTATTDDIQASLQTLVNLGFDDLAFAKQFRKMKIYHTHRKTMTKRMDRKRRQCHDRMALKEELMISLAAAEQDVAVIVLEQYHDDDDSDSDDDDDSDDHEEKDDDDDNGNTAKAKNSFVDSLMGRVQSIFGASIEDASSTDLNRNNNRYNNNNNNGNDESPTVRRNRRLERKVLTLQKKVAKAQESIADATQQLEWLQQEYDALEPTVSSEEYDATMSLVKQLLADTICPALAIHIAHRHQRMIEQYQTLDSKTDLTTPHEWYLHARLDQRTIIYHGGPTNSGKTYTALQQLKRANRGLYVGPLRLLAAEIYETLTAQGVYTNLMTGQETRHIPFATHTAATVELALQQTDHEYDVAVIDEIQMMADPSRGFAWTRALLGLQCREIHVCGGMEACELVKKLAKDCGDKFVLHEYERFSPLTVAETSMGDGGAVGSYKNVQPGDCVVAFSRADIFAIKREIESLTDYKCCIIYGSLPPETRADQARRFNNPDSGYDILVASDAIGMGLNLNIRRTIFNSIYKSNGETIVRLNHSSVKQIAGRAGRRNSPYPEGQVTCRDPRDLEYLQQCMSTEIATIRKAGLLPTPAHIALFSEALLKYGLKSNHDEKNLHKTLVEFSELATLQGDFFLCRQASMRAIARFLTDLDMDMGDKYMLCMAPVSSNHERSMTTLRKFAVKHSQGEVSGLSRTSSAVKQAKTFDDLSMLCEVHADLELFLWLHNRFPGNVMEQQSAVTLKERAIGYINRGLQDTENLKLDHCYVKRDARLRNMVKKNRERESEESLANGDYYRKVNV